MYFRCKIYSKLLAFPKPEDICFTLLFVVKQTKNSLSITQKLYKPHRAILKIVKIENSSDSAPSVGWVSPQSTLEARSKHEFPLDNNSLDGFTLDDSSVGWITLDISLWVVTH